jgi:hypothetical protein
MKADTLIKKMEEVYLSNKDRVVLILLNLMIMRSLQSLI